MGFSISLSSALLWGGASLWVQHQFWGAVPITLGFIITFWGAVPITFGCCITLGFSISLSSALLWGGASLWVQHHFLGVQYQSLWGAVSVRGSVPITLGAASILGYSTNPFGVLYHFGVQHQFEFSTAFGWSINFGVQYQSLWVHHHFLGFSTNHFGVQYQCGVQYQSLRVQHQFWGTVPILLGCFITLGFSISLSSALLCGAESL